MKKRILMLMTAVALMEAMLVVIVAPAFAAKPEVPGIQKYAGFGNSSGHDNPQTQRVCNIPNSPPGPATC